MEKERKDKTKCVNCGSSQIYIRLKENEIYCRICGFVEDLTKKGNKE